MDKILVTRSSMPEMDEYIDEIRSIWDTHWLTNMGEKHRRLQAELKEYLGVENIELLVNGHMALELVIQAFDLKGEIITTPFTFASTTHAIVRNGIKPVFCDIEDTAFTMDASKIEALITEKTSAIMPVHVYGNVCDVEEIERIAKKHDLRVIYDAAHAFGETYNNKGISSYGDASIFSFHATKVYNTIEGGAVCFKDTEIGERLYDLKNFGIHGEEVSGVGANAKMNEFCAAMGLCNLKHIEREIEKRRAVFERYMENLGDCKWIRLPYSQENVKKNYAYFPVVFGGENPGALRDEIFEKLKENGIYARKYFYPPTNEFECYSGMFEENTPVAHDISRRVLTLPIYADLSIEVVDKICGLIKS